MWLTHLSLRELRQGSTQRFNLGELEQVLERAACSLACCCLPSLLSFTTQNHLPEDGTTRWAGLSNFSHSSRSCFFPDLPLDHLMEAFSYLRVVQMTPACVKSIKNCYCHTSERCTCCSAITDMSNLVCSYAVHNACLSLSILETQLTVSNHLQLQGDVISKDEVT